MAAEHFQWAFQPSVSGYDSGVPATFVRIPCEVKQVAWIRSRGFLGSHCEASERALERADRGENCPRFCRSRSDSPRREHGRRRSRSRSRSSERALDITGMSYDEYLAAFNRVRPALACSCVLVWGVGRYAGLDTLWLLFTGMVDCKPIVWKGLQTPECLCS